jgi:type IV secretion system protein VirB9
MNSRIDRGSALLHDRTCAFHHGDDIGAFGQRHDDERGRREQTSRANGAARPASSRLGPDGKVVFLFGETQPSVICSPLQVCDIELQGGEIVRDVLVGDTVRWKVEPATSGAAGGQAST